MIETRRFLALIRGINLGKAKRVAMSDLRSLGEGLGFSDVCTVLNSGNIVFKAVSNSADAADRIRHALFARRGVQAEVFVLTGEEIETIVDENPLGDIADNPSRSLVAFLADLSYGKLLLPLLGRIWTPEAFALGKRVAYLWCPNGVTGSPVAKALAKALGNAVTIRNWATVIKIQAVLKK